ncbi:hypothetical protein JCM8208_007228 [Rhodotorula glutinis]
MPRVSDSLPATRRPRAPSSTRPLVQYGKKILSSDQKSDLDSDEFEDDGKGTPLKKPLWDTELDNVLYKGMRLLPKMGTRAVHLETDGQSFGRNGLLAEYVRRQTGKYRSRRQVTSHLVQLRLAAVGDQRFDDLQLFVGHDISRDAFAALNWSNLLGDDLYPETAPAAKLANDKHKLEWEAAASARKSRRMGPSAIEPARSSQHKKARRAPVSSSYVDSSSDEERVVDVGGGEPEQLPDSRRIEPEPARSRKRLRSPSSSSGETDAAGRRPEQEGRQKESFELGARRASRSPLSKRASRTFNALADSNLALASPALPSSHVLDVAHPLAAPPPRLDLALAAEWSSRIPSSLATSTTVAHGDLLAFLAGLHPSLVALSPALAAAGFTTVDALAKLVLLEPSTIALVLDWIRRRPGPPVSVIHLRMLGRELEEAGRVLRGAAR